MAGKGEHFLAISPMLKYNTLSLTTAKYFDFRPVVQEEMPFKDISYIELWQPFCSVEGNHMCNFHRGYYEEQFCEKKMNLDQWLRRKCRLNIFLI